MMSPFEPPLQLAGTPIVFIRSLDDAAGFLRGYIGRWPVTRDLILQNGACRRGEVPAEICRLYGMRWNGCG